MTLSNKWWIEFFFWLNIILFCSFQITHTQENQITYIIDHRTFEPPIRKPNWIKWTKIFEESTEEKSIQLMLNKVPNVAKEITIQKQVISSFCSTTPTHAKRKSWLRTSHLNILSLVWSQFLRRWQASTDTFKGIYLCKEGLKQVNENREQIIS